jgi:hypothetical protein
MRKGAGSLEALIMCSDKSNDTVFAMVESALVLRRRTETDGTHVDDG